MNNPTADRMAEALQQIEEYNKNMMAEYVKGDWGQWWPKPEFVFGKTKMIVELGFGKSFVCNFPPKEIHYKQGKEAFIGSEECKVTNTGIWQRCGGSWSLIVGESVCGESMFENNTSVLFPAFIHEKNDTIYIDGHTISVPVGKGEELVIEIKNRILDMD